MRLLLVPLCLMLGFGGVKFILWLHRHRWYHKPGVPGEKNTIAIAGFPRKDLALSNIPEGTTIYAVTDSCAALHEQLDAHDLKPWHSHVVFVTQHGQTTSYDNAIRHLGGRVTHVPRGAGKGIQKVYFDEHGNEFTPL